MLNQLSSSQLGFHLNILNISAHFNSFMHIFSGNKLWSSHQSKGILFFPSMPTLHPLCLHLSFVLHYTNPCRLKLSSFQFLSVSLLFTQHANHLLPPPFKTCLNTDKDATSLNIPFTHLLLCLSLCFLSHLPPSIIQFGNSIVCYIHTFCIQMRDLQGV